MTVSVAALPHQDLGVLGYLLYAGRRPALSPGQFSWAEGGGCFWRMLDHLRRLLRRGVDLGRGLSAHPKDLQDKALRRKETLL
jgi:hypothetical protein